MGGQRQGEEASQSLVCKASDDAAPDFQIGANVTAAAGEAAMRRMLAGGDQFAPGTEVWARRAGGYHHAGIAVGGGMVVHLHGEPSMSSVVHWAEGQTLRVPVVKTTMQEFSHGDPLSFGPTKPEFSPDIVVARALRHVGELLPYDPRYHNCQHFTSLIVSGHEVSPEADDFQRALDKMRDGAVKVAKSFVPSF